MKFGKNANVRGRWLWIELSDKEVEEALDELLVFNIKQLENIMKGVKEGFEYKRMLADKNLISAYTYLSAVIDKKIEAQKNPQPTQDITQHPMYKKAEQYAERKLTGKAEEPTGGPSLIEKAMNSIEK
jgi:hypothetical protein